MTSGPPWRSMTIVSAASSWLLNFLRPEGSPPRYTGYFVIAWSGLFVSWSVWAVFLWPKFLSPLRNLPTPSGGSILHGQFAKISKDPTGIPQREWANTVPNNGLIRYLGLFNQERLVILSPKALSEVLVTKSYVFEKPAPLRHTIGRILGVGILLAEGDEHRLQRKNLMPAFAFRHVKDLYPVFWRKGREVVRVMTDHILQSQSQPSASGDLEKDGQPARKNSAVIEVGHWASRVTLDIIGEAGMGRDFGAIHDPNNELNQTYQALFKPTPQARTLQLLGLFIPNWIVARIPVQRNHDMNAAGNTIRAVCFDLIREKKEKLARKELTDVDILSVALESGVFSDEDLVNQLMTFLAAGHETTASAMTWAIYELAKHPEIARRLRQEVRENLPPLDGDTDVSSLKIDHLPYLNAFCNELLRYWSPVPMTVRDTNADVTIMDQPVPKGTRIILVPWATNFDKTLWGPDADEFKPERWLAKSDTDKSAAAGGSSSNYALLTFLHGPRSCIGQAFAKAEFACLLATWVGRFEFELRDKEEADEKNIEIKGGITARPARGLYVHATVVDGW